MDAASPHPADDGTNDALIRVRSVSKSFGTKLALREVSLAVPPGQVCGLLGPNGAGKTTLFRLMMGILKPTSGTITIDELDAFENRVEVKRRIGFLPDEPVFYAYLSGREILALSAAMHGIEPGAAIDRLRPLIARLRMTNELDAFAEDYSRGMKKKLGLLLAMVHRPRLLVLDEPTNGIDVEATREFYDLVGDLAREGMTILFSTHLMDHVARLCSHAVILHYGRVVADGPLEALGRNGTELEETFLKMTAGPRA